MKRWALAALIASAPLRAEDARVGAKVPAFVFTSLDGAEEAVEAAAVTVVTFFSARCPVSNDYNERMDRIYGDYRGRGVRFYFVDANVNEPAAELRVHAKQAGFRFPVFRDVGNAAADALGAELTPETFVIDSAGVLRYRGAIDDSRNPARVRASGLRAALDAVLAGAPVAKSETKAFGCTIKRAKRGS